MSTTVRTKARVVVVGGGMAGLAAAFALAGRGDVRVTLYEADERFGGKVRSEAFAGLDLDLGPDAFLADGPRRWRCARSWGWPMPWWLRRRPPPT
ncbi:MAG: FAD-dependent oxidoreductase, partial [Acidimicrobiia bacterium]|nr:FAD-dependent oxidoreductase [Acidimicrobiia bacterium]